MISGWKPADTPYISLAIKKQDQFIQTMLDEQLYNVVGTLSILGFQSEAFYRVKDFGKEVSIVPVSARTGVGIPELLTVLVGLTQQYMQKRLEQEEKKMATKKTPAPLSDASSRPGSEGAAWAARGTALRSP